MVKNERATTARRENNLLVLFIALVGTGLGVFLMWTAGRTFWGELKALPTLVREVGGLITATALLAAVWELAGRRTFARETMAIARVGTDIERAGIKRVTDQYNTEIDWTELIKSASKIDIVVAYARTWRNTHHESLKYAASRRRARIRVFLPDPDDDATVAILAQRFDTDPVELRATIREAIKDFSDLAQEDGAMFEVYVRAGDAVFSCYRFDGRAVLTLYSHARERQSRVPTFELSVGDLWSFVYDEVNAIHRQSKQVYPPGGEAK